MLNDVFKWHKHVDVMLSFFFLLERAINAGAALLYVHFLSLEMSYSYIGFSYRSLTPVYHAYVSSTTPESDIMCMCIL